MVLLLRCGLSPSLRKSTMPPWTRASSFICWCKKGSQRNIIPKKEIAGRSRMWGWHYTKAVAVLLLPLFQSIRTLDHTVRSTTPPSPHVLKAEAHFRICAEEVFSFHCVCRIVPESVGSILDHVWGKWASSCFAFQGSWVVTPIQLQSLSSNRENIQLCLFPLFTGNLIYFCEFLNIYNPFIEDLLGGICLLWEVKERPRKWFSILSAS